ncbi:glycosyl transferase, family 2 [sediment metagenome]|uniref:Glycosyl transferase, family 2 n=1 Tax=sediment metagenome TaxID=749907 RepID=D9PIV4_9ZZZZ
MALNMPSNASGSHAQPVISVVTAVHNQLPYNRLFFDSLSRCTYYSYELVIVNNSSTDGSEKFFSDNGAVVLDNKENVPYSAAQNQGLAVAKCRYVAFLNNDICLSPQWDRKLIEYMEDYNIDVICPCGIENMETPAATRRAMRLWRYINFIQRFRIHAKIAYDDRSLRFLLRLMYGNWEQYTATRAEKFRRFLYSGVSGYAVVVRGEVFKKVGKWNEDVAAADADLSLRMTKRQVENGDVRGFMVAGDVFVHHFIRATFRTELRRSSPWNNLRRITDLYSAADLRYLDRPRASVIIAVYNHPEFLEKVLESLTIQNETDFEVVISDDGSGPEINEVVKRYHKRFRYPIRHVWQEHDGFRKTLAANKSVAASRANYLIFIDGDCVLHSRFVERHLRRRRLHTVLSGRRVKLDEETSRALTLPDIKNRNFEKPLFHGKGCERRTAKYGVYRPYMFGPRNLAGGNYDILGCNFSVYKGDYYSINGYEERIIGRGLEDNNLCNRFKAAGMKIVNIAYESIEFHLHHSFDPVPHSRETVNEMGNPDRAWSATGICKKEIS